MALQQPTDAHDEDHTWLDCRSVSGSYGFPAELDSSTACAPVNVGTFSPCRHDLQRRYHRVGVTILIGGLQLQLDLFPFVVAFDFNSWQENIHLFYTVDRIPLHS